MKKFLSVILAIAMITSFVPYVVFAESGSAYNIGDTVEFGNYPQSLETDETILAQLESIEKNWLSFGYYRGTGGNYPNGKMAPSDYMRYAEIDLDGDGSRDYRAITFDQYRPEETKDNTTYVYSDGDHAYQKVNGYFINTVYYFKYEPLTWRIIDPETGFAVVDMTIDCQPFQNYGLYDNTPCPADDSAHSTWGDSQKTFYANNYYESSLRKWLNDDFFNTAFTAEQASNLRDDVEIDNSIPEKYTGSYKISDPYFFGSKSTNDKIYLLSRKEVSQNSAVVFSSESAGVMNGEYDGSSDYAKANNLKIDKYKSISTQEYLGNYSHWWIRSSDSGQWGVSYGTQSGTNLLVDPDSNKVGVKPACRFVIIKNDTAKSSIDNNIGTGLKDICIHANTTVINAVAETCGADGYTGDTFCNDCNTIIEYGTVINATGEHNFGWVIDKQADCENDGLKHEECSGCGAVRSENTIIAATGHVNTTVINAVAETCGADGYTGDTFCNYCNTIIEYGTVINATGEHNFGWVIDKQADCENDGLKHEECSGCGAVRSENTIIAATGHVNTTVINAVAETCGADGYTGDTFCNDCNKIIEYGTVINATGEHNFGWVIDKQADCENDGLKHEECSGCGAVRSENTTIAATGHVNTTVINAKEATSSEAGYTGDLVCESCKKVLKQGTTIPAGSTLKPEDYFAFTNGDFEHRNNGKNWDFWFENSTFVNGTEFVVTEATSGNDFDSFDKKMHNNKFKMYDLSAQVGEMKVQPNGDIWIALPIPGNFNPETTVIYYVNGGILEPMPCFVSNGKIYFVTNHFSSYVVADVSCAHVFTTTVVEVTCEHNGYTSYKCNNCSYEYRENIVESVGHIDSDNDGICDVCSNAVSEEKPQKKFDIKAFFAFICKIIRFVCNLFNLDIPSFAK